MAASTEKAKKVCYYELLGLDRRCEAAEIKASYRKLALQMHPDKAHQHGLSVEEATKRFQQVQEAYSVLSDAQERAWYDAHREQILRGDDEPGEDPFKTKINLYKYFSTSCFDGFGDGAKGFFAVYAELFEAIDTEEAEWEDADEDHTAMPPFGNSASEWADVSAFYRHWLDFCSRKAFGHADKWNPKEAQNRQVRRAMEQENKKARQAAQKDFNAEVRQVVRFVQKRDPRVAAHQKQQMKAAVDKKQRDLADKEQRKVAEVQERQERKDAARRAEEERWAEAAAERAARRARGEVVSEDEASDKESEEAFEYRCEACRKSFKSEKAYDQHAKSKKHLQLVAKLRKELEQQLQAEAAAQESESEEEEESDGEGVAEAAGGAQAGRGAQGAARAGKEAGDDESEEEEDEEDEDDFVARFAAARKPAAFSPPQRGKGANKGGKGGGGDSDGEGETSGSGSDEEAGGGGGDDSSEGSDVGAGGGSGAAGGGGKRAQKREKQRAILLEKKAEKANVQELVNNCRKAAKAANAEGAADEEAADVAAVCPPTQLPSGQAADTSRCAVCGDSFPSRSKLFQHIKASGHAALKPAPGAEAAAKGKKKKR